MCQPYAGLARQTVDGAHTPTLLRVGMGYTFSKKLLMTLDAEKDIDRQERSTWGSIPLNNVLYLRTGINTAPSQGHFGAGISVQAVGHRSGGIRAFAVGCHTDPGAELPVQMRACAVLLLLLLCGVSAHARGCCAARCDRTNGGGPGPLRSDWVAKWTSPPSFKQLTDHYKDPN